ncbi:L-threonylcarbamoyladenylate synthase [soil metagenome]
MTRLYLRVLCALCGECRPLRSSKLCVKLLAVKTLLTSSPEAAAAIIKRGGVVAFPTETVYGLGADIFEEAAIRKVFEAKGRPADNPLIAHVADASQIKSLTDNLTPSAELLLQAFAPGPLTVVVHKTQAVPLIATAGLETIGIRMPRLPIAREFLAACGVPVVAPSANLSGRPSPTTWEAVLEDLDERIDCILQGSSSEIGLESTVVDCTHGTPVILRAGAISIEQLRELFPEIRISTDQDAEFPRSPGLKHRHYSPKAAVVVGNVPRETRNSAFIGLRKPDAVFKLTRICTNLEEYAQLLYEFFRECDRLGIDTIYCEPVTESGLGTALMDRIHRAAEV